MPLPRSPARGARLGGMIRSFRDRHTQAIWEGDAVPGIPVAVQAAPLIRLRYLARAANLEDLFVPPGNHLEKLRGDRRRQYSIRSNRQWRICFRWEARHAHEVELVDYHR